MQDIARFFIDEEASVIQAMEKLDSLAMKVLFVASDGRLAAALTDGDIRRHILSNRDLNEKVAKVANYNPKYVLEKDRANALEFMKDHSIEAVPIVDEELHIIDVVFWNEKKTAAKKPQIDLPVVMMAGGMGTRLYPYTKILPKPLIPIGEIPIAEHIINRFTPFGCKDIHLIVNYKKNMIKAYFNEVEKDYTVNYVDEEKPLGTGGGLSLLRGKINKTFILTNCDILIEEDISKIYDFHRKNGNVITMVCALQNFQIPYGVVTLGEGGSIEKMEEKPSVSFFTNTGCYIVEPEVIDAIRDNEAIGFPTVIENYRAAGRNVGVYPIGEGAWMDMGQMDELEKMRTKLSQN